MKVLGLHAQEQIDGDGMNILNMGTKIKAWSSVGPIFLINRKVTLELFLEG